MRHLTLDSLFNDIATALQERLGISDSIVANDFPEYIDSIEDDSECTLTSSDMVDGKTAYVNGQLITGSLSVYDNSYIKREVE